MILFQNAIQQLIQLQFDIQMFVVNCNPFSLKWISRSLLNVLYLLIVGKSLVVSKV